MSSGNIIIQDALQVLDSILLGQKHNIRLAIAALISRGHILLEGPPGVGKTTLAKALSQLLGLEMNRVQMTSDLLPSDLLGFLRPTPDLRDLEFRKGPIFCNLLLTDELNRCPPKTQSALLEAMGEGTVSIDGKHYVLPEPFYVIATQNPTESFGTFPLAESELDRFMVTLVIERPDPQSEVQIYLNKNRPAAIQKQLSLTFLKEAQKDAESVSIEKSVFEYFYKILEATRNHPEVKVGASVRAGIHYLTFSKSLAYLAGRKFMIPSDITEGGTPILSHRLVLTSPEAPLYEKIKIMESILSDIRPPR